MYSRTPYRQPYGSFRSSGPSLVTLQPDADANNSGWTDQVGGNTNLYLTVDEATANDADYVQSSSNPIADIIRFRMSDPTTDVGVPFNVSYRYGIVGVGAGCTITARLYQGSTVIKSWVHTDATVMFKTVTQTLSAGELASITNFNDLFVEFEAGPAFISAMWNASDKDSGIVLTNPGSPNGLTFDGNNNNSVRATKSVLSGQKIYYENIVNRLDFRVGFGFANAYFPLQGNIPGDEQFISNAICLTRFGDFHMAAGNGGTICDGFNVGDTVDIAWDIENLFWARVNNGAWNSMLAGTQNPATGQGGFLTNLIVKGQPWFPLGYTWLGGATSNFGTGPTSGFTRTIPAGFTAP